MLIFLIARWDNRDNIFLPPIREANHFLSRLPVSAKGHTPLAAPLSGVLAVVS